MPTLAAMNHQGALYMMGSADLAGAVITDDPVHTARRLIGSVTAQLSVVGIDTFRHGYGTVTQQL